MTAASVNPSYTIEVEEGHDWTEVAEARSLEIAMLRARHLFRDRALLRARVIATMANGVRRIYTVQRPEAGPRRLVVSERDAQPIFPVVQKISVAAALGFSLGITGLIVMQMLTLISTL